MRTLVATGAAALPFLVLGLLQPGVTSVSLSPSQVDHGGSARGTVTLSATVPSAVDVSLSSTIPSLVRVPATVRVPAGSASGAFVVGTASGMGGCASVFATLGKSRTRTMMFVNPPTPIATSPSFPVLVTLSVPASIVSGQQASATATHRSLTTVAEQHTIGLTSSNPAVASVPATVFTQPVSLTNPSGTLAPFTITTTRVSIPTCVIIKASGTGGSVQHLIRILPPS